MNLKKELEKMNHTDLLWVCKYMKVRDVINHSNKQIISILLEPINNKKYGMINKAGKTKFITGTTEEDLNRIAKEDDEQERRWRELSNLSLKPIKEEKSMPSTNDCSCKQKTKSKSWWWPFS